MKCINCNGKLTPITTVTWVMKDKDSTTNDKQVRRGMKNHRACYMCDKVFRVARKMTIVEVETIEP